MCGWEPAQTRVVCFALFFKGGVGIFRSDVLLYIYARILIYSKLALQSLCLCFLSFGDISVTTPGKHRDLG